VSKTTGNTEVEGQLTGVKGSKVTIRTLTNRQQYEVSADILEQISAEDLLPSPVKVQVQGKKVVTIAKRKLDL